MNVLLRIVAGMSYMFVILLIAEFIKEWNRK